MVGIQIHSVDNNAAVPWEWHTHKNETAGTKEFTAGSLYRYGTNGLTSSYATETTANQLYLTVTRTEIATGTERCIPLIPIRDDMVLEGYVLDPEENPDPVNLGDKCWVSEQLSEDGFFFSLFTPSKLLGDQGRFEVVGIIPDCEPVKLPSGSEVRIFTKKVLVRLVK